MYKDKAYQAAEKKVRVILGSIGIMVSVSVGHVNGFFLFDLLKPKGIDIKLVEVA